eukprot:PhM_4_TR15296/c0_g1_i1/m.20299
MVHVNTQAEVTTNVICALNIFSRQRHTTGAGAAPRLQTTTNALRPVRQLHILLDAALLSLHFLDSLATLTLLLLCFVPCAFWDEERLAFLLLLLISTPFVVVLRLSPVSNIAALHTLRRLATHRAALVRRDHAGVVVEVAVRRQDGLTVPVLLLDGHLHNVELVVLVLGLVLQVLHLRQVLARALTELFLFFDELRNMALRTRGHHLEGLLAQVPPGLLHTVQINRTLHTGVSLVVVAVEFILLHLTVKLTLLCPALDGAAALRKLLVDGVCVVRIGRHHPGDVVFVDLGLVLLVALLKQIVATVVVHVLAEANATEVGAGVLTVFVVRWALIGCVGGDEHGLLGGCVVVQDHVLRRARDDNIARATREGAALFLSRHFDFLAKN